jgi:hypothetical protein
MTLATDFAFALEEGPELPSDAAKLRYVAAINLGCTKAEFVEAAVAAGFPRHAAGARFGESRRVSLQDEPDLIVHADGRLTYPQE